MLQTIREHTHGWIAGTIIFVIILTFALWGIHSYFVSNPANSVVAVVNGKDISREQLTTAYERLRRQVQSQYGYGAVKDDASLKKRALNNLVETEALLSASLAQGFAVFDQQVDSYLQSMPQFQVEGEFSLERFQELIASSLLSVSQFLEIVRTGLLIDQPRLGLMLTSFALPEEAELSAALVDQQRDIDYVDVPVKYFKAMKIDIPQKTVSDYYLQHEKEFKTPEQVDVEYLELSLNELSSKVRPSEAALHAYYKENMSSYTLPMAWTLQSIKIAVPATATPKDWDKAQAEAIRIDKELKSGGDFKKLASKHSVVNLEKGPLTLSKIPAELQKTAANLTEKGEVSKPLRTATGYVILKAIEIRKPVVQEYATVKDKVKKSYVRQQANEKFATFRDKLADLTYAHPDSLKTASDEMSLAIKTSQLFTRDKEGKGVAQYRAVRDAAFSDDAMSLQNNSDVIQLQPGTVIVLRVKSHISSKLLPLKDVSSRITEKLKADEAELRAKSYAKTVAEKLNAGADPATIVEEHKFKWKNVGYVGRYSTKVDSAVLEAAFRMPRPNGKHKVVYGITRLTTGYAIVAVKAVKDGVVASSQSSVFDEQIQNSEALLEYNLYKASQIKGANIKLG